MKKRGRIVAEGRDGEEGIDKKYRKGQGMSVQRGREKKRRERREGRTEPWWREGAVEERRNG